MSVYDIFLAFLSAPCLVLTGLVVTYGTSDFHLNAQQIEARLETEAVRALEAGGYDWARVQMDGQTALLSGTAPDQTSVEQALQAVALSSGAGGWLWGGIIRVEDRTRLSGQSARLGSMPPGHKAGSVSFFRQLTGALQPGWMSPESNLSEGSQ